MKGDNYLPETFWERQATGMTVLPRPALKGTSKGAPWPQESMVPGIDDRR